MAAAVLAGCQKNEINPYYAVSDGVVKFVPSISGNGVMTKAQSVSAETLDIALASEDGTMSIPMTCETVEGIGNCNAEEVVTKGELINEIGPGPQPFDTDESFVVKAWDASTSGNIIPGTATGAYQTVTYSTSSSLWSTSENYYWNEGETKTFYAYSNLPSSGASIANTTAASQTLTYTVPSTASAQTDILMGSCTSDGKSGAPATMTGTASILFSHPLTAVQFKLGTIEGLTSFVVNSITIEGVYASGTAVMTPATAAESDPKDRFTWTPSGTKTVSQTVSTQPTASAPKIGEAFLLIPQSFNTESTAKIVINCTIDGKAANLYHPLTSGNWKAGYTNTYTLGYTNPSPVHFVDLGLPSGILWADKNVGATSVTDMGDHYPWGETEEWYSSLSASYDYTMKPKYSGGFTVANYNSLSNMKSINANLTGAYEQYDVAAATYGDGCRMPSNTEFDELKANCYWRTVTSYGGASVKGVVAFKVQDSSHKGKCNQSYDSSYNYDMPHIFIPDNGYGQNEVLRSGTMGSGPKGANAGYYWLSDYTAHSFSFSSNLPSRLEDDSKRPRYLALGVRPVKKFVKSHEYVEIGGLKWATCNIGANSPKEYGWYFSWAGTTGYVYVRDGSKWVTAQGGSELSSGFSWGNTPYHEGNVETTDWKKYIPTGKVTYWGGEGSPDNILELVLDDDAARANWGDSWRMPTEADFQALYEDCGGTGASIGPVALSSADPGKGIYWVSNSQTYISDYNGVAGILFCNGTSKLFFAAAGYGDNTNFAGGGTEGRYWSGTVLSNPPSYAYRLGFQNGNVSPQNANGRNQGFPVRPVSD